jgi:hypothetical protein
MLVRVALVFLVTLLTPAVIAQHLVVFHFLVHTRIISNLFGLCWVPSLVVAASVGYGPAAVLVTGLAPRHVVVAQLFLPGFWRDVAVPAARAARLVALALVTVG